MTFVRNKAIRWHEDVPGSRWFRADLHVHTLDDHPGGRVKMPAGLQGSPTESAVLRAYARRFLQAAVQAGVQVVGLTPHAARTGEGPETSAVWQIVRTWNEEDDDDGVPFRDKVYAVFPGFEPNLNDGGSGVHLLFLFDPEIGRDRYLDLFNAVMDGQQPWQQGKLRMTTRDAKSVFATIDARQRDSQTTDAPWEFFTLAPHFQNGHGVLNEVKKQVLENFPCDRLSGYELGHERLPDDFDEAAKPGEFLLPFMARNRQAFFHGSDAYKLSAGDAPGEFALGNRTTWVKLAAPRIAALRQAFIASESRLRIAYERGEDGALRPLHELPDPLQGGRRWLRRISVRGGASFFGGRANDQPREVSIPFSPDLTCIIGGSMTGKSTLLDGLRVHVGANLPQAEDLQNEVEARGRRLFLAGQPEIQMDAPGANGAPVRERWPARFFTQDELRTLIGDDAAVEEIIAGLVSAEQPAILDRKARLKELDESLSRQAVALRKLLEQQAEAEQQLAVAQSAKKALEDFKEAGLAQMQASERLAAQIERAATRTEEVGQQIADAVEVFGEVGVEAEVEAELQACLQRMGAAASETPLAILYAAARGKMDEASAALSTWAAEIERVLEVARRAAISERKEVERKLAEHGYGAERLAEFQTLNRRAGLVHSYKATLQDVNAKVHAAQQLFERDHAERERLVEAQRKAFERVAETVEQQFQGRILVRRLDHAISGAIEQFLHGLKQKGITMWWNNLDRLERPSPEQLAEKLGAGRLAELGVSDTVAARFEEVFDQGRRYELRSVRSPDRYVIELQVDRTYREMTQLSGGKRVSVLLSLLLEAHDDRPLVIDQPEDELDNRFLWETVLPALRRLKGRRQVIVATHNPNIVVNGDADLVVQLEADADHGRVAVSGAIEDPAVRTAIIDTVDGGAQAFELRKAKYGF